MEIGKIWPGWETAEFIGEGSFGKVYKITRQEFGHTYESALKVITIPTSKAELSSILNDGFDEESATLYFRGMVEDIVEEFALMSKLRGNSNIVSYEDHAVVPHKESIGWDIYIRMELLHPLFEHIKEHPLSVRDVIQLGIDICKALEVCQNYNIIHRDIKPENIFVSDLGQYKLGDFGIARQLEKTSSGLSKKGTYSYMAPEVYKGEEYNAKVDIYSLGIVLYRFLNNNRTPFLPPYPAPIRFTDRDKANGIRFGGEKIVPPCNATEELANIVLKACAFHAKERYENAHDMREALQELLYSQKEFETLYPTEEALANETNDYASTVLNSSEKEEIEILQIDDSEATQSLLGKQRAEAIRAAREKEKREEEERRKEEERQKAEEEERAKEEARQKAVEEERQRAEEERRKQEEAKQKAEEEKRKKAEEKERKKEEARQRAKEKAEQKQSAQTTGQKNKKIAIAGIAAAVLVIIIGILAVSSISKNNQTEVPNFSNMTLSKAETLAADSSLILKKSGERYSDTVEKGNIISQTIEKGAVVKKESTIEVEISLGKEAIEIPSVTGIEEEKAKQMLKEAGFAWKMGEAVYSDSVEAGIIVSQTPEKGQFIADETIVTLVASKGIEPINVPYVVGMSRQEAEDTLKQAGLKVKVMEEEDYNDTVAAGIVVSQDIGEGESVLPKTKISIVISKGPKPEEPAPAKKTPSQSQQQTTQQQQPQQEAQQQAPPQQAPASNEESIDSWELIN